jgi:hypothetical protein
MRRLWALLVAWVAACADTPRAVGTLDDIDVLAARNGPP